MRDAVARLRPVSSEERVAVSGGLFLHELLGNERRETRGMGGACGR